MEDKNKQTEEAQHLFCQKCLEKDWEHRTVLICSQDDGEGQVLILQCPYCDSLYRIGGMFWFEAVEEE